MSDQTEWVLVPRVLAHDMLNAGISETYGKLGYENLRKLWAAMLAAAPTPPSAWNDAVEKALGSALSAMSLAAALPAVAAEYDFSDAIAAVRAAWVGRPEPRNDGGESGEVAK